MTRVDRFQIGRRWVERGHRIKVLPSAPGKQDGFEAKVLGAKLTSDGTLLEVDVFGAKGKKAAKTRTFRPDRLRAMVQPKEVRPK